MSAGLGAREAPLPAASISQPLTKACLEGVHLPTSAYPGDAVYLVECVEGSDNTIDLN